MTWTSLALRFFGCLALANLCQSCGPQNTAGQPPSSAATEVDTPFAKARIEAIRRCDEALALKAPTYAGSGEKGDALAFINGEMRAWFERRRERMEKADNALTQARQLANNRENLAELAEHHAALWMDFVQQFLGGGTRAMPRIWRNDPLIQETYENALLEKALPWAQRAADSASFCARNARHSDRRAHCQTLLQQAQSVASRQRRSPTPAATSSVGFDPRPPVPQRPILPSTQPKPCAFRGTLKTRGLLFRGPSERVAFAELDGGFGVEVDSLVLPTRRGGRARLEITFPLAMTAWLDPNAVPLTLEREVVLVPNHIWLPRGFHVAGYRAQGTTAKVFRKLSPGEGPPSDPALFEREMPCTELGLANEINEPRHNPSGKHVAFKDGNAEIYAAPGGQRVGAVTADDGHQIAEEGKWRRVRGSAPFHFDAWVEAGELAPPEEFGLIGLLSDAVPTHEVAQPLALRARPERQAPIVTTLAPGSSLVAREAEAGFIQVQVAAAVRFVAHDPATGKTNAAPLYARKEDFETNARKVPPRAR